jgi:predicted transcriptional regulator
MVEKDCPTVEGRVSLEDFISEHVLHSANRCFIVTQDHRLAGLITRKAVEKIPREQWSGTTVQSVMHHLLEYRMLSPDADAIQALEIMSDDDTCELAVMHQGQIYGISSRDQVVRFLRIGPN